jgi:3-carboxy-cis,cis-muconate cycloisomerase
MLDVEAALLGALERSGAVPAGAREELLAASRDAELDLAALGRATAVWGTPVPGMLAQLRERLGSGPAGEYLHWGATSQDIVDTAAMLVARRALRALLADLAGAADACALLAERHRADLQAGRTLLQHASPITFGLKAAGWLVALEDVRGELARIDRHELVVQLGGAVGTLAALGEPALEVVADVARHLELGAPQLPWHAARLPAVRLACQLGVAAGAMGKVALDVTLMAQTEVAEASEGTGDARGGSSTLPHKRNPVGAVAVLACARRAPSLVATMLASMNQEHERATGAWQAEWETQLELLCLVGSATAALHEVLDGLEIDARRMRANLGLTGELLMSESVVAALAATLGPAGAREVVGEAAAAALRDGRSLREGLVEHEALAELGDPQLLARALSPERYLGATDELIDRALARHGSRLEEGER